MKNLMATLLVGIMALGLFGMVMPQPVEVQAASSDLFKDFDVSIGEDGKVIIESDLEKSGENPLAIVLGKYKDYIGAFVALCAISLIGYIAIGSLKLASNGDNSSGRKSAQSGIFWTVVSIILLGGAGYIVSLFFSFLK